MEKTEEKHVLVVEDETIIAINIVSTLKQFGYIASYVSDGDSALEYIKNMHPDLVLMDIMLNGEKDGIEVAKVIKNTYELPLIYLTAYSDDKTLDRAKSTEPFGYLIKPFNSRDLYISVEIAIYKSRIQKELKQMQAKVLESQKWETLGLISAGISHEINNPLTTIINNSELLLKRIPNEEISKEEISRLVALNLQESERIAKIVKHLISYAKEDDLHFAFIDLNDFVIEIRSFFHQLFLKEKIAWEILVETDSPIPCYPQKIKHFILKMLQTSRQRLNEVLSPGFKKQIQLRFEFLQKDSNRSWVAIIKDNAPFVKENEDPISGNEVLRKIVQNHKGIMEKQELETGNEWVCTFPIS